MRYWRLPLLSNDSATVVVTDGLAAVASVVPPGVEDGVPHAELGIEFYPEDFPLTDEAFRKPQTRWPLEWLRRLTLIPMETGTCFRAVNLIADDPPKPLGEGTAFVGWLVRSVAKRHEWAIFQRMDGATVEVLMATPLFADELVYGRSGNAEDLIKRLRKAWCLDSIWPHRRSVMAEE